MGEVSYTAHISNGKSAINSKSKLESVAKHNLRKYKSADYSSENIVLLYGTTNLMQDVKLVYKVEFEDSIEKYNTKQNREERKIMNYFKYVSEKGQDMAVEIIFQCGDKKFWEKYKDGKDFMKSVYEELLWKLQEELPNFKVANAVIHFDEASPHMHVVGVPVGRGFKNGPSTKVSKRSVFTKETLSVVLQDKLREEADRIMRAVFGKRIAEKSKGRNHDLTVAEYKLQQTGKQLKVVEEKIDAAEDKVVLLTIKESEISEEVDKLVQEKEQLEAGISYMETSIKDISENMWEYENLAKYQLREPESFMGAKSYKEKIVVPLVKNLKDAIRGLIIRINEWRIEYRRLQYEKEQMADNIAELRTQIKENRQEIMRLMVKSEDLDCLKLYFGEEKFRKMVSEAKDVARLEEERKRMNKEYREWKERRR